MNMRVQSKIVPILCGLILACTAATAQSEVLFEDDFEYGALDKWTFVVGLAEIVPAPTYTGSHSLHIPFDVPAGEPAHKDNNRFVQVDMAGHELDNFFVRGCFYLASTATPTYQRKLFYIWSSPRETPRWDIIVQAQGGVDDAPLRLSVLSNAYSYSNIRVPIKDIALGRISYDMWHCLDLRVQLNTPNRDDGWLELWVDGTLEAVKPNLALRIDEKPLGLVRVGAQIDRNGDTLERHEDRYWDNVSIGTGVTRTGETVTPPPEPPTEVRAE